MGWAGEKLGNELVGVQQLRQEKQELKGQVVKTVYVHQRPTEPGYMKDSPDGWDDATGACDSQAEAVRRMQQSLTRPARIIKRETVETVIVLDSPRFDREDV